MPLQTYAQYMGAPQQIDYNNLLIGPKIGYMKQQNLFNQQKMQLAQAAEGRAQEAQGWLREAEGRAVAKESREVDAEARNQWTHLNERYDGMTGAWVRNIPANSPLLLKHLLEGGDEIESISDFVSKINKEFPNDSPLRGRAEMGMSMANSLLAQAARAKEALNAGDQEPLKNLRNGILSMQEKFGFTTQTAKGPATGTDDWFEMKKRLAQMNQDIKEKAEELTPEATNYVATQFRISGKMPSLGMGAAGARIQVLNRAAIQTAELGDSAEHQVARQASLKAFTAELGRIQGQRGLVMSFKNAVMKNLELVRESSGELKRSAVPALNRWLNAGRRAITGDVQVSKFDLALRTVINEFARVTTTATGGGVTSDTARKEINDLLNDCQTPEQVNAVIDYMVREMKGREQGYNDQITATMQGIAAATGVGEPGAILPKLGGGAGGKFEIISVEGE